MCDGSAPKRMMVGVGVNGFSTRVVFEGTEIATTQWGVTGSLGTMLGGWTLMAHLGATLGGTIEGRDVGTGGTLAISGSRLLLREKTVRPFVSLAMSAGASTLLANSDANTRARWTATDARIAFASGKTFADRLTLYGSARVFGGPVFWRRAGVSVTGSDKYHFGLGVGAAIYDIAGFDLTAEFVPLGERSATLSVSRRL